MFDVQTTADVITLLYPNSNLTIRIHHHSETKELWFVASDVCKILQLSNASHFVSKLDKSHVIKYKVLTSSGTQSVLWVDVQGAQNLANVVHTKTTKDFLTWLDNLSLPKCHQSTNHIFVDPVIIERKTLKDILSVANQLKEQGLF